MASVLTLPMPQSSPADGISSWSVGGCSRIRIGFSSGRKNTRGVYPTAQQLIRNPTPRARAKQTPAVANGTQTWHLDKRVDAEPDPQISKNHFVVAAADTGCTKTWSVSGARPRALSHNLHSSKDKVSISVIAPGGGTTFNTEVYALLRRRAGFQLDILGQSRAPYDRYPPSWAQGAPAPNLETFAAGLLSQGIIERSSCLVFGSRGGQVVLPFLWRERGAQVPPAIVMNGGCAMKLPCPVQWPDDAVTFLLLGGQDYFNQGQLASKEYLQESRRRVPLANGTTAILLVNEMVHMPQTNLLKAILDHMITAVVAWKTCTRVVRAEFDAILKALISIGMSGRMQYTNAPDSWEEFAFDRNGVVRQ